MRLFKNRARHKDTGTLIMIAFGGVLGLVFGYLPPVWQGNDAVIKEILNT